MRAVQGELQHCAQLWVPYFLSSVQCGLRAGFWVFVCVSFLPPDLRRWKKGCLPLCTWFKTALWSWQDGDVAHTRDGGDLQGGTTVCRTYRGGGRIVLQ